MREIRKKYRIEQLPSGVWKTYPWPEDPGTLEYSTEIFEQEENAQLDAALWQRYEDTCHRDNLDEMHKMEVIVDIWRNMIEIWRERGDKP